MYYHASKTGGLKVLKPSVSNHHKSYVYFSDKRENILIYTSNPVEKFCLENNFKGKTDKYKWFAPYGFNKESIFCYEEYCPNLLYESYYGVGGYIYSFSNIKDIKPLEEIRNVFVSEKEVKVDKIEYVENVYDEFLKLEKEGKIKIYRYNDISDERKNKIKEMIIKDYIESKDCDEIRYYYEHHFDYVKEYKDK